MNKEEKNTVIADLKKKFQAHKNIYVTDTESLSVAQLVKLRKKCFEKEIDMRMAKNTLIDRAITETNEDRFAKLKDSLKGVSVLWFSENPKEPAVILSEFRIDTKLQRPVLKAALIGEDLYVGDSQIEVLKTIKSKQELIGDVLSLLQSPIKALLSGLQSSSSNLAGALKALAEKNESA